MKKSLSLLLILPLALFLAACQPTTDTSTAPGTTTQNEETGTMMAGDENTGDEDMIGGDAVAPDADYTLVMENYSYTPNAITASPGETITVKLISNDMMHDFVIDELEIQSEIYQEGEEGIIEITIPEDVQPGDTYEFYCSVGDHRDNGMVGTLTIN